jgi:hypothetical protein
MAKCGPMQFLAEDGKCYHLVDQIPGARISLVFLTVVTFISHIIIIINSINRILGIWIAYRYWKEQSRPVQHPWRDFRTWAMIVKCISSILMAVAYVDMWGFLGHWTVSEYLGMYAPAYGLIPLSTTLIQLNFVDRVYLQQRSSPASFTKSYSLVTLILVALTAVYALFGYTGFGLALRSAYLKDPNTKLGITGNILSIVSYSLLIFNTLFGMIPCIWMMIKFGLFGFTRSEKIGAFTNDMISWAFRVLILSVFSIVNLCMFFYIKIPDTQFTGKEVTEVIVRGILPTILSLTFARFFEIALAFVDLDLVSAENLEVIPGIENFVNFWYDDGMGRYSSMLAQSKTQSVAATSRGRSGTATSRRSKNSSGMETEMDTQV